VRRKIAFSVSSLFLVSFWTSVAFRHVAHAQISSSRASVSSVRILFGLTDAEPTRWDGTVALDSGTVSAIQGWRFGAEDSTDYSSSWKAATRAQGNGPDNILENGVLITAETASDARWSLHTPKGDFSFTLHDIPWGEQRTFLDGAIAVDRVPPTAQLTTSDDDEAYPAIARAGDSIWVTFVRFAHSDREKETFQQLQQPPASFDYLARPAGGDQVLAMRYSITSGKWDPPVPVSPRGEDVAGAAISIDGQNRVWAIWSARRNGNSDLYARVRRGDGEWEPEKRLTSNPGVDLSPVAATDSGGRVWIAWQGFRNNNLEVLAAVQNGESFSPGIVVSFSAASDWDPAIAASANGDVAIAWDTYDKGDYDVWFRRMRVPANAGGPQMDPPVAVAATESFEAHPSIAFDARNRLWAAYEISGPRWGKNFGAFDTTGSPLYEDRDIRVKCFDGDAAFVTSGDLINVMPGPPVALRRARQSRGANRSLLNPNPNIARNRRAGQGVGPRANGPLNSLPRIAVDPAGAVYLAFRSLDGPFASRSSVGSVWFEQVVYYDGHNWAGPVFLPRTDGLLSNRPALVAWEPGRLLAVSAMDHRQSTPQGLGALAADRINSDLYSADLRLDGVPAPASKPELMTIKPERPAPADPHVKEEREQVALVRGYRIPADGAQLRILRGDFNRHTEYSVDGARDGSLDDAYRYMIDAAALDWGGCCDNENGGGHEYFWWTQQKMADEYLLDGAFLPLFAFTHAVAYPEGQRSLLFAKRGVRPVPHLPIVKDATLSVPASAPDTQMLYRYLRAFGGVSIPHASATNLGTDWRDNDPDAEPAVEIYQGDRQSYERPDAPRAAGPEDTIQGWHAAGTVTAALDKGYRLGFVASSDHFSTHLAYANVLVAAPTRDGVIEAFKKRHIYASTGNIVADVRSGDHIMGDAFTVSAAPSFSVRLIGTAAFMKVTIVKDGHDVYTAEPKTKEVGFTWRDDAAQAGKTSYYYVRGEQADGQLVWASPMWITVE
jgi:hypothetical protein